MGGRQVIDSVVDEGTENYLNSTLRERIVEHLFVGEALKWPWNHRVTDVEVLRSEFDAGGYDLVMSCKKIVRHIQFKTTSVNGKAANIKASLKLLNKPSGCIIWIFVTPDLKIAHYRWFGGDPDQSLPDIRTMKPAKHTKGNAEGVKTERPQQRIIPKGKFSRPCSLGEVMERLFGRLT
jgi:hypothetical protein